MTKRSAETPIEEGKQQKTAQKATSSISDSSVSRKTAHKWMKELNIDLELVTNDADPSTMTKTFCRTCKDFAPALMSSSVNLKENYSSHK